MENNESPRTEYISITDAAKDVRAKLKAKGIRARQVSVRCDGSSLRVRILDAAVKLSAVKEIATAHEKIDRDHATGEILCGGNRFVDVEYAYSALAALIAEVAPAINALADDGTVADIGRGLRACVEQACPGGGGYVHVWRSQDLPAYVPDRLIYCWGRDFAARQLAIKIANGEVA